MPKAKSKPHENFFEIFAGEYCEIVLGVEITNSFNLDKETGATEQIRMPLTVAGFVMDADDMFLYLSPDGESIDQAFPLQELKHIAIAKVEKEVEDDIPNPGEKDIFN